MRITKFQDFIALLGGEITYDYPIMAQRFFLNDSLVICKFYLFPNHKAVAPVVHLI